MSKKPFTGQIALTCNKIGSGSCLFQKEIIENYWTTKSKQHFQICVEKTIAPCQRCDLQLSSISWDMKEHM